jgi:hypothetical protein
VWVLGAADPEMERIASLLRDAGESYVHATIAGRRVRAGDAYRADLPDEAISAACAGCTIYLVECVRPMAEWSGRPAEVRYSGRPGGVVIIDHHRLGDPGYGVPPAQFLIGSSLGQVLAELARLGVLVAREWREIVAADLDGMEAWDLRASEYAREVLASYPRAPSDWHDAGCRTLRDVARVLVGHQGDADAEEEAVTRIVASWEHVAQSDSLFLLDPVDDADEDADADEEARS